MITGTVANVGSKVLPILLRSADSLAQVAKNAIPQAGQAIAKSFTGSAARNGSSIVESLGSSFFA